MTRRPFSLDVKWPALEGDAVVELRAASASDLGQRVVERSETCLIEAGWPAEISHEQVVVDGVAVESRLAIRIDVAGWPFEIVLRAGDDATRDAAAPAVVDAVMRARVREVVPTCASDLLTWFPISEQT